MQATNFGVLPNFNFSLSGLRAFKGVEVSSVGVVSSGGETSTLQFASLPGEFAIQTDRKWRLLTAVGGGGKSTDVIHTDAGHVKAWEKFKIWAATDPQTGQVYYAIQTINGHFITANNAGGLTSNTVFTTSTGIGGWETFKLTQQTGSNPSYAIATLRGFYLTAVGGGGHNSGDTIHTDATAVKEWEKFNLLRGGDLGSGSVYAFFAVGGPAIDFFLTAANGGRVSGPGALNNQDGALIWISWALFKQNDGSYAFQTNSGSYLTANEGGIGGTFRTDATTIGNWEKFTVIDNGDCTCYIKTYGGYYLTLSPVNEQYIVTTTDITKATKWKTMVIAL